MSAAHLESSLYRTPEEVEALVRRFESCALSREEWTHAAHLTVALWYLLHHSWPDAVRLTRDHIKRFNHAHGILTTPTGGYHETLTLFWLTLVRRYLNDATHEDTSLVPLANNLILRYARTDLPLHYYTHERLFSPEARAGWIEPDLKSLDE
ncbi:MAG TPA: hypothetical protein VGB73_11595 [Pyrinomonadaceae bacterium]|jgi:hypothetical protein